MFESTARRALRVGGLVDLGLGLVAVAVAVEEWEEAGVVVDWGLKVDED